MQVRHAERVNTMDAFEMIQQLSNERHELYKTAGREHLNASQMDRLHEINNRLPLLWDEHRRELALRSAPRSNRSFLNLNEVA
jgi:hypothetical protein